jgi:hypothetical protein
MLRGCCSQPMFDKLKYMILLEAPRMDTQSWPGEPQDCNQAAQECTAEQDTGVRWRSLCTMPITGVTAINGDPSCENIWITGVYWRYL